MASEPKASLNDFLRSSKADLTKSKNKVTIVVGNESCDLDSMTSAVLYAWFRSKSPSTNAFSKKYVPLLNIPRADVKLRLDFKALFHECNVDEKNLTTLTDLPSEEDLPAEQTQWVLVDHNKLEGDLGKTYYSRVVGCIDHHEDEKAMPDGNSPEPRIIETSGSCTSLVLRELAKGLHGDSDQDNTSFPADVLKLGLASILVDTENLKDKHKTRDVDIDIAGALNKRLGEISSRWDSETFYKTIIDAKGDLTGLSVKDILRKDYKQWTESGIVLGTSSCVKQLDYLYNLSEQESNRRDRSNWRKTVETFMKAGNLNIWAIINGSLTQDMDGEEKFRKQIEIHWLDEKGSKIVRQFAERFKEELQLTKNESAPEDDMSISWNQGNLALSRKQIAPMLRTVMKEHVKS